MGVSAVLDFEMATIGPAEVDLAWFVVLHDMAVDRCGGDLPGFPGRDATIAAYESRLGRPVADLRWYEAFAALRSGAILVRAARLLSRLGIDDSWLTHENPTIDLSRRLDRALSARTVKRMTRGAPAPPSSMRASARLDALRPHLRDRAHRGRPRARHRVRGVGARAMHGRRGDARGRDHVAGRQPGRGVRLPQPPRGSSHLHHRVQDRTSSAACAAAPRTAPPALCTWGAAPSSSRPTSPTTRGGRVAQVTQTQVIRV